MAESWINPTNQRGTVMKTSSKIKAGGIAMNHNAHSLRVKTGLKAGGGGNGSKPGGPPSNHNEQILRVKTGVKAGSNSNGMSLNHNERQVRDDSN